MSAEEANGGAEVVYAVPQPKSRQTSAPPAPLLKYYARAELNEVAARESNQEKDKEEEEVVAVEEGDGESEPPPLLKYYARAELSEVAACEGGHKEEEEEAKEREGELKRSPMEPVYAAPDEMNVRNNKAYDSSSTFTLQVPPPPIPAQQNIYFTPGEPPTATATKDEATEKGEKGGTPRCCGKAFAIVVCAFLLLLAIGTGGTALAMELYTWDGNDMPTCGCAVSAQSEETAGEALRQVEGTLNQTRVELEQSVRELDNLSLRVAELSENVQNLTSLSLAPPPPGPGIGHLLQNCTTRTEAACTVDPEVGKCQTPCTNETQPGSVALNFQCLRLESPEQNPLIGVLDVTNGLALCLCYVLEFDGLPRSSPVKCVLKVTRCSLVNLDT